MITFLGKKFKFKIINDMVCCNNLYKQEFHIDRLNIEHGDLIGELKIIGFSLIEKLYQFDAENVITGEKVRLAVNNDNIEKLSAIKKRKKVILDILK